MKIIYEFSISKSKELNLIGLRTFYQKFSRKIRSLNALSFKI